MRAVLLVVVSAGCISPAARARNEPPARLTLGAATRHFSTPASDTSTFRTTTPTPTPTQEAPTDAHAAYMGTIGFTMATRFGTYAGGEVETGVLNRPGSSASSVYGVIGVRQPLPYANLAIELAAGRRWVRYDIDSDTLGKFAAEPRLRADAWLSPQFSIGATAGLTLGDQTVWMAGVFLGIHSHDFGRSRP